MSRVLRGLNNSPSPATLSRARYRLDAFLMLLRQEQWRNWERGAAAARLAGQLASSAVICIGHSIAVGVLASACRLASEEGQGQLVGICLSSFSLFALHSAK